MRDKREQPEHDSTPTRRPASPPATTPAQRILDLQRQVGNAAVAARMATHRSTVDDVLRSPGHPLDEPVRHDMEARLGADFSSVRLHTGPAAQQSAADLGARAYTSGDNVVLGAAPVDQHTLAHELAHVVQQRTGPVSGTDRGDGLRVSDPTDRHERAAETTATRAMREPGRGNQNQNRSDRAGRRAAHQVLQRAAVWYTPKEKERKEKSLLIGFGDALDKMVKDAANEVFASPDRVQTLHPSGFIDLWYLRFWAFVANPKQAKFMYTSFGYAVETLVTQRVANGDLNKHLPSAEWQVVSQLAVGHTRPDLVVLDPTGNQVGWFDITSERSKGHIKGKIGAGWKSRDYVAEATYPKLDLSSLRPGSSGPAQAAGQRGREAERRLRENRLMTTLHTRISEILADMQQPTSGVGQDRSKMRTFLLTRVRTLIGTEIQVGNKALRSLLERLDKSELGKPTADNTTWLTVFGFTGTHAVGRDAPAADKLMLVLAGERAAPSPLPAAPQLAESSS